MTPKSTSEILSIGSRSLFLDCVGPSGMGLVSLLRESAVFKKCVDA
jgi:hypothetical protein